jgi:uncharacterized membrane protein YecN with MAPEG domain
MAAPPLISALYAAPLAVLAVGLGVRIALLRMRLRVGLGDGGKSELARAIRVHANLLETAPIALLMLVLAEVTAALDPAVLHGAGTALVAGRLLHAFGLSRYAGASPGRFTGMLLTWGATLLLAVAVAARALR